MKKYVLTIGNFDGLHRGHQRVIRELKNIIQRNGFEPLVLTFSNINTTEGRLMSEEGKRELLKNWDMKIFKLNREDIFHLSPEEFVRNILVKKLNTKYVVIGENFRFGYRRKGDIATLKELGKKYNFQVKTVPLLKKDGEKISSGDIRKLLEQGKLEEGIELLGHPYEISGEVISGRGRGTELGFPTANLKVNSGQILPPGVFIAKVSVNNHFYRGVVNIGMHPTFTPGNTKRIVEVHLPYYQGNLYQKRIKLSLLKKIRKEKKFITSNALKKQIEKDIMETKHFFVGRP